MNDTNTSLENIPTSPSAASTEKPEPQVGRNEPCPCGSGKKYKRCHGVGAAPKLTLPTPPPAGEAGAGLPNGFDPSKMDPAMMQQMAKSLQRLPRNQLQRLQSIMQRAMAGQDVAREAADFERLLPPEFQQMAMQMMMAQGMANAGEIEAEKPMDATDAKLIVAKAVAEGKMSADQAKELLGEDPAAVLEKAEKSGISKFFGKLTGK